jgi:hypothetical protein
MHKFTYEYTDTLGGEANYCWVKRGAVYVPELTHYGYTGSTDGSYSKANKAQTREVMRQVKAELGLTGVRGVRETWGDLEVFKPYGMATILFVEFADGES